MRLGDVSTELATYIATGLRQQGRTDLAALVPSLMLHRVEQGQKHISLETVPSLDMSALIASPERERLYVGRPRGVKGRSWGISLEVVGSTIHHIGVSHPSILRPIFAPLAPHGSRDI